MHVAKLKPTGAPGFKPAGAYFAQIAAKLEDMNADEAARLARLDDEDGDLEAHYGRRARARERAPALS